MFWIQEDESFGRLSLQDDMQQVNYVDCTGHR